MKQLLRLLLLVSVLSFCAFVFAEDKPQASQGGLTAAELAEWKLEVSTDKPDALYKSGETCNFKLSVLKSGVPVEGVKIEYLILGENFTRYTGEISSKLEPVVLSEKFASPGFFLCEAFCLASAKDSDKVFGAAGAGADPLLVRAIAPEPADFDVFWDERRKELAKLPVKEIERKLVAQPEKSAKDSVDVFDVKVSCLGEKPVSGYLCVPKGAKAKSLPAVVSFHGAGVDGARMNAFLSAKYDAIWFDINAHGLENGQPKEFYDKLSKNELKDYFFQGMDKRETCYFLGMYLRALRAVEYVKSLPEWDGSNLLVTGGSQGGAQALAVAGLDPQVSFCAAAAPWLCNFTGVVEGSVYPNWPGFVRMNGQTPVDPVVLGSLPYFDPALHAKRIKSADCVLSVGFIDRACPPASVYVAFNNIKSKSKRIFDWPKASHSNPSLYYSCGEQLNARLGALKAARSPAAEAASK